MKNTKRQ